MVGFVLRLGLQLEEPAQIALDLGTVGAGRAEEDEHLVVVLASGPFSESGTAYGVG